MERLRDGERHRTHLPHLLRLLHLVYRIPHPLQVTRV